MKDLCLGCGAEHDPMLWGAECSCAAPNVVHQQSCGGCGRVVGQITDDDYCGPEKLYCPDCIDAARLKKPNVK
jgi:hypothetical protein